MTTEVVTVEMTPTGPVMGATPLLPEPVLLVEGALVMVAGADEPVVVAFGSKAENDTESVIEAKIADEPEIGAIVAEPEIATEPEETPTWATVITTGVKPLPTPSWFCPFTPS